MILSDEEKAALKQYIVVGGMYKLSSSGMDVIADAPDEAKKIFYGFLKNPVRIVSVCEYLNEWYVVYFYASTNESGETVQNGNIMLVEVFAAMFERIG